MKKYKALYKGMYDDLKDAEMMIEYACEIAEHTPDDKALADELAKYAKDVAAGAVLVMSLFSIVIGIIIFLPKVIELLGGK